MVEGILNILRLDLYKICRQSAVKPKLLHERCGGRKRGVSAQYEERIVQSRARSLILFVDSETGCFHEDLFLDLQCVILHENRPLMNSVERVLHLFISRSWIFFFK